MKVTSGKITNKGTGDSLKFTNNPTAFRFSRGFTFAVDPCLGEAFSHVAYRSAGASSLSFQLRFDKDLEDSASPEAAFTFFTGLNKIVEAKKSVPEFDFEMGSFQFTGYVQNYVYQPIRFDDKGDATSCHIELNLLSNGDYEQGTAK